MNSFDLNNFNYDLHIHSCLSPCGNEDMTPNNIVNMAAIKNLNIIAVSDHNTAKNCRAVIRACENNRLNLTVIPAIEITTSEDVHILAYFKNIDAAEIFEREVIDKKRMMTKNKPEIFGGQIIMNEFDEKTGEQENLLISAVDLSVDYIYDAVREYHAVSVPAHIDKEANGIISILGDYPEYFKFKTAEIKNRAGIADILKKYNLKEKGIRQIICSSDAHYLWDIAESDVLKGFSSRIITSDLVLNFILQ